MFSYNKNYEENKIFGHKINMQSSNGDNSESDVSGQYKVFTYDFVIKKITECCEENTHSMVRKMAQWKLRTTENVLLSLLKNSQDRVAW